MIQKLIEKIQKTKAPICVGLDPMLNYIPEHILKKSFGEFGETLEGAADAIWNFNKEIVDHTWDLIPSVKPQIAMYEQFGIEGLKAYDKTVKYCQEKGLVVIGDAKRGDIGSTSAAYATAHLGKVKVGNNICFRIQHGFPDRKPVSGNRWRKAVRRCLQRREQGYFRAGQDLQPVQRRVPGQTDRRQTALRACGSQGR